MARYEALETAATGDSPHVLVIRDNHAGVEASVCLSRGAELCSLRIVPAAVDGGEHGTKVEEGAEWVQLLDRANDFTKPTTEWSGRAQHLFPAVGRTYIDDTEAGGASRFIREGTQFSMPLHGFIKDVAWSGSAAVDATGARIQCSVESSSLPPAFKAMFPFAFKISAEYSIQDGGLQFVAKVTATGEKVLPFSIGNHIALKYPFLDVDGSEFNDGLLKGSVTKQLGLSKLSVLDGSSTERPELAADGLTISKPENRDTVLGGAPESEDCYLDLEQPGVLSVRVTHLTPDVPAAVMPHRYFVLWGEVNYMCPEPWLGAPSSLSNGKGLVELEPGTSATWGFRVSFSGPRAPTQPSSTA